MSEYKNDLIETGIGRRTLLTAAGSGILLCLSGAAFAEELTRTPKQTEGPFYPDHLPLDTDNDLVVVNDSLSPALGAVTYLSGRVLDAKGEPIRNAVVEIWQVDNKGSYLHSKGANSENGNARDSNFQGFGRFLTGSTGEYLFRTIKPVPYPGRTPHIHFAIKMKGREKFTTQCYVKGESRNESDGVLKGISNPKERENIIIPFSPVKGAKAGELAARFDIVMGFTPTA
jgi:protocatechuate 3,4-dioxygenase beta subunit